MSCFEGGREVSASFLFIQAKTSDNIDVAELNHFFSAVNNFIGNGTINNTEKARELRSMCQYILNNPTQLSKNPDCHLVYAYAGDYTSTDVVNNFVAQQKNALERTEYFDNVTISIYDATQIVKLCREIKNSIKKSIELSSVAALPHITNVKESYVGIVSCADYIKLITNEQGAIRSNLFEYNVRYFQGVNAVNREMQNTLRNEERQQEFSILNNGVTIVAKEVRLTGQQVTLTDFQIVNGCQTSFVLYENRNKLKSGAYLVVKIISTENKDISDRIVATTNKQTPILDEAFETLRDFHKELEIAYASYPIENRLYYERRSKQYDASGDEISRTKIVSYPNQTAAYVAVFLDEPHSTHRYYGELFKSKKEKMYIDGDILEQYCMASFYVYTVDKYLKQNGLHQGYKQYKFHIAFMLRCLATGKNIPNRNSREMKRLCDTLFQKITDTRWVADGIKKAINIIQDIVENSAISSKNGNDIIRQKEFTTKLIEKLGTPLATASIASNILPISIGMKVNCQITGWNNSFAYAEIIDYREVGSIHIKSITGAYLYDIGDALKVGQKVEAVVEDDKPHLRYGYPLSIKKANP
ncbi:MAG: AIPR family protein [Defluviitaleaceae bacterium]|nr:AIPR family protein [Defluviitaleaceae bacterium]